MPVLRDETVRWLVSEPSGVYADCTLGGGGHSEAILRLIGPSGGRLVCADRDVEALRQAGRRLRPFVESGSATLLQTNFGSFPRALERLAPSLRGDGRAETDGLLSGLLLDLGVSSHQIDDAARGFSFRFDGPLDMRMDQSGGGGALTAATIVNEWEPSEIADVLWRHGEERASRMLARAIVAARPVTTTAQLARVVREAAGAPPKELTKRAARVFQALRIQVNREMDELDAILVGAARLVKPGGRIAVMSYHSLEDRKASAGCYSGGVPPSPPRGKVEPASIPGCGRPVQPPPQWQRRPIASHLHDYFTPFPPLPLALPPPTSHTHLPPHPSPCPPPPHTHFPPHPRSFVSVSPVASHPHALPPPSPRLGKAPAPVWGRVRRRPRKGHVRQPACPVAAAHTTAGVRQPGRGRG